MKSISFSRSTSDVLNFASWPIGKIHPTPTQKKYIKIAAVIGMILLGRGLYHLFFTESTDDSFVKAHVHVVSSRITGTVKEVLVSANQIVKKGDVLVKLDPRDYEVQVKAAQATYGALYLLPLYLSTIQGYNSIPIGKTIDVGRASAISHSAFRA